ncbi:hypothetical protein C2S51_013909 [Perilla frutescens var. frutescens]|nr:hypothetical protein C2S51_013909 [Perilla frutescens var. frutescens]
MASLNFLAAAIITTTFIVSSTLALSPNMPTSAALPPDIAPLLPSSGGGAGPPTGEFMPIIPSSRSPPNPDITGSTGLDTAFGPSGPLQDSSAVPRVKVLGLNVYAELLAFWLVLVFYFI